VAAVRVLLLVDCYYPSPKSSAKLVHDLAVEIVRRGHEAVVAAPDDALDVPARESVEDGVTVVRVRTGRIKGASLWRRGWNEMRLPAVMWKAGRAFFQARRCDLVAFYSPTIFFGPLVRRLKRLWGCPTYLILRDIFPQWAVDAGALRKGLAYLYFKRMERLQYDVADRVGVQSPANLEYFKGQDLPLEVLYNWTSTVPPAPAKEDYRKLWGLENRTVFFYGGNIGVAQDVDNLVRLAAALEAEPSVSILLVGEGSEVERLRALGRPNLQVRDAVSQEEYAGMVGQFDVGLISLDRRLRTQNVPGKLLSYLVSGLPVLASVNPGNDLRGLLENAGAGLVSENGDDAGFVANARALLDAPRRRDLGERGRTLLASTFSVGAAARRILAGGA
jgi:glycosyltransferase involved in cell wall biosynthesis